MNIADVRDGVVVVAGIIYILLTLIVLVVLAAILYLGRKAMRAVHRLVKTKVVTALNRAQEIATKIEERTAALPGAPGASGGVTDVVDVVRDARAISPPFRSRKRTWRPF
jgi:hypothetical protein